VPRMNSLAALSDRVFVRSSTGTMPSSATGPAARRGAQRPTPPRGASCRPRSRHRSRSLTPSPSLSRTPRCTATHRTTPAPRRVGP
jgi:hypothetical protein